jgi:hypothetical protein
MSRTLRTTSTPAIMSLFGLLVLAGAAGCTRSSIVGPLSHVDEERDVLLTVHATSRSRTARRRTR